jgi:hypothetical protein
MSNLLDGAPDLGAPTPRPAQGAQPSCGWYSAAAVHVPSKSRRRGGRHFWILIIHPPRPKNGPVTDDGEVLAKPARLGSPITECG